MSSLVGFVLATASLLAMLHVLAARITAGHLLNQADQELGLLASGQPLWQWHLSAPSELIAGRAFGHARVSQVPGGLKVTSMDGSPFELGLPIASRLDLVHWPLLDVQLQSHAAGTVDLLSQGDTAGVCIATAVRALPASSLRIDLRKLAWKGTGGMPCPLPESVQMLRLRITLPAGADVDLREVALRAIDTSLPPTDAAAAGTTVPEDATPAWMAAAASRDAFGAPLFHVTGMSAETLLRQRDLIRHYRPGALIVPAGSAPMATTRGERPAWLAWVASLAYLLSLFALARWHPAGKRGLWLGTIACIGGPLWLIAGLQWGMHPSIPGLASFAGALVFAAVSDARSDRRWRWLGPWPAWRRPLALVPVALLLCVGWGHPFQPILVRHALLYLGWALLQQWLILAVVMGRLDRLLPGIWTAPLLASLIFALLHTPNGNLMTWCLLAELYWAWCFRHSRSLLPIGLAHAACALIVESGLVGRALRSLEVGARFFS